MVLSERLGFQERGQDFAIHNPNWVSFGILRIQNRGIDFSVKTNLDSIRYETLCFDRITVSYASGIWIGPHLTDTVFRNVPGLAEFIRPDAIQFELSGDAWEINSLAEFKSSRKNGTTRKLEGFAHLLSALREDCSPFLRELHRVLDGMIHIPRSLIVPPEKDITVYMVSPYNQPGSVYSGETDFSVEYVNVRPN